MPRPKRCKKSLQQTGQLHVDYEEMFSLRFIDTYIGCGVFTRKEFRKGDFLLEYKGLLCRSEELDDVNTDNGFTFFFKHENKTLCIDATEGDGYGRMVNDQHGSKANCKMKKYLVEGVPKLGLFALRNIGIGEELRYDYGVSNLPWRKLKRGDIKPVLYNRPQEIDTDCGSSDKKTCPSVPNTCLTGADKEQSLVDCGKTNDLEMFQDVESYPVPNPYLSDAKKGEWTDPNEVSNDQEMCPDVHAVCLSVPSPPLMDVDKEQSIVDCCNDLEMFQDVDSHPVPNPSLSDAKKGEWTDPNEVSNDQEMCPDVHAVCLSVPSPPLMDVDKEQSIVDCCNDLEMFQDVDSHPVPNLSLSDAKKGEWTDPNEVSNDQEMCPDVHAVCLSVPSPPLMDVDKAEVCTVSKKIAIETSKPTQCPRSYISQFLAEQRNRISRIRKNSSSAEDNYEDDGYPLTDDSKKDSDYIPVSSDQESSDNMFENYSTKGDKVPSENLEDSYISDSSCSSDASEIIMPIALPALQPDRKRNNEIDDCQVSSSDSVKSKKVKRSKEENLVTSSSCIVVQSSSSMSNKRIRDKVPKSKEENLVTSLSCIVVQSSSNTSDKRVWDKKHFCYYCGKTSTNITKHYFGPHKEEPEVKEILSFPLKSEKRKLALQKLRNTGDFKHNVDVLKKDEGTLVTWSRKSEEENISADNYLPCEDCLGFFLKSSLWRHRKVCPFRKGTTAKYGRVQSEASLLLPCSIQVSEGLTNKVISKMINDEIKIVAKNDWIINKIGQKLYKKHGHLPHLYTHISQKMRELARFLIAARKVDPEIQSISDVIHPQKFKVALKSTQILCHYSEDTNRYGNPSLALKMGHQLKKCAKIKKSESTANGDFEEATRAEQFLSQIKDEWSDEISSPALQTLANNKMNKAHLLPLAEDIKILQSYLNEKTDLLSSALQKSFSKAAFDALNQITLARLVLFNRRRGGETERITVKSYLSKLTKNDQLKEIEDSLSPVEKMLCSTFGRVEIRGKKGRIVPVLLTPSLQSSIDLLMKWRNEAEIHKDNQYVFARPNFDSINPIRSSDVLRKFANDAGLSQPENITSTKLRKHVATVSQILNLRKSDMEAMANFMGHDMEVHRSFYRLPQETIQIARMGRLLSAFDKGTISNYSGKSLDEIPLNEDTELSSDDEEEEEEEEKGVVEEEEEEKIETPKKGPCERKVQRLTDEQNQILKRFFRSNVAFRRELKRKECTNAIQQYPALRNLDWKKVKNTVHNWITSEKRKMTKLAHKK